MFLVGCVGVIFGGLGRVRSASWFVRRHFVNFNARCCTSLKDGKVEKPLHGERGGVGNELEDDDHKGNRKLSSFAN